MKKLCLFKKNVSEESLWVTFIFGAKKFWLNFVLVKKVLVKGKRIFLVTTITTVSTVTTVTTVPTFTTVTTLLSLFHIGRNVGRF